jgi:hypothetical protein
VAVGPAGTAVSGWLDEATGAPFAAVRRAGVWGAARKIYVPGVNEYVSEVRVAVGGDGTALAATVTSHFERGLAFEVVKVSLLAPTAVAWGPATEVSVRQRGIGNIRAGMDQAGNALVIWGQPASATSPASVRQSARPAGGAWSAAQDIAPAGTIGLVADFTMNHGGAAVLAWTATGGTIRSLTRQADGTWLSPVDVAAPSLAPWGVKVGIDAQGRAAAVWASADGTVSLARQAASGSWDPAVTLNDAPWTASAPDVDVDDQGDLAVVWSEVDSWAWIYRIHAQLRRADGSVADTAWEPPTGGGPLSLPSVAFSPDGSLASLAWTDEGTGDAWATTFFAPTTLWSAPARLGPMLYGNAVALAAGPSACAVWPAPTARQFVISLRAASFDPTYPAPTLTALSPAMIRRGTPLPSLAVAGAGFVTAFGASPSSVVQWDGTALPTDFLTPGSLSVPLSSAETEMEGRHAVRVLNPAPGGGTSAPRSFIVDGTAPATAAALSGTLGANGWWTSAVRVTLLSQDNLSGVATMTTRTDAAAPVVRTFPPTSPPTLGRQVVVTVSGSLVHRLEVGTADAVGNAEAPLVQTIPIDVTPPTVSGAVTPRTLAATPGASLPVVVSGSVSDVLSGVDPASATFAVVDEYGEFQPAGAISLAASGTYRVTVPLLAERRADDANGRTYTITVTAKDRAGLSRSKAVIVTVL